MTYTPSLTELDPPEESLPARTGQEKLETIWFDSWDPALDTALQSLPETDNCPHELFRLLVQTAEDVPKRIALVTKQEAPVAVVGLRQMGRYTWEPVTRWIIPGIVFPAKPGYLIPALEQLGVDVRVAWWRIKSKPKGQLVRALQFFATHRIKCCLDTIEQHWRSSKHYKNIRGMRNRCRNFTLAVNSPGLAEWTIRNWEKKWRDSSEIVAPSLPDRILAANYLESQGQHYTLSLLDQGEPIGGITWIVHHNDLVAGICYREPEYDWYGVGIRLLELSFSFAVETGFETIDIGGGHHYKKYWAPQQGHKAEFNICPEYLWQVKQAFRLARNIWKGIITNFQ